MGAGIMVGHLAGSKCDPEGYEMAKEDMEHINRRLAAAGLPRHEEPEVLDQDLNFSCDLPRYCCGLRRFAAWLALENRAPDPTTDDVHPIDDLVYARYCEQLEAGANLKFQHLMDHSDAEGYYVPVDFPVPLPHDEETASAGGPLGSVIQLQRECREIATRLALPVDSVDVEVVYDRLTAPPTWGNWLRSFSDKRSGHVKWRPEWDAFNEEAYACLQLLRGCAASMKARSAMHFC